MQNNELLIKKVARLEDVLIGLANECHMLRKTMEGGVSTSPNSKKAARLRYAERAVSKRNTKLFSKKNLV